MKLKPLTSESMVFHHPFPVSAVGNYGSRVRPHRMIQAFRKLGYEVVEVVGYGRERRRIARQVARDISNGRRFAFAYSESHTLPTLLTESHHLPTFPLLDFGFLARLKDAGTPIGLFYRDVYWRSEHFRDAYEAHKRAVMTFGYRYDWLRYRGLVDHLFLPSLGMQRELPSEWPSERLSALPPGLESHESANGTKSKEVSAPLSLIYVGGVTPPLYDLTPLFDFMKGCRGITLSVCCRKEEWESVGRFYNVPEGTSIVHAVGRELEEQYSRADVAVIVRAPHPYLDFAMPVKLFEALGFGLPVIASGNTEAARFVRREDVGWVVHSSAEFRALVKTLKTGGHQLGKKRTAVESAQKRHTWQARARAVADTLMSI